MGPSAELGSTPALSLASPEPAGSFLRSQSEALRELAGRWALRLTLHQLCILPRLPPVMWGRGRSGLAWKGPSGQGFQGAPGEAARLGLGLRWAGPDSGKGLSSPRSLKYLGSRTSEKVKNKILELLYSWAVGLPEEVKIAEAYQMLKKQGEAPDGGLGPAPPPSSLLLELGLQQLLTARSWLCSLTSQEHRAMGPS